VRPPPYISIGDRLLAARACEIAEEHERLRIIQLNDKHHGAASLEAERADRARQHYRALAQKLRGKP
jgi:hypothetical protein